MPVRVWHSAGDRTARSLSGKNEQNWLEIVNWTLELSNRQHFYNSNVDTRRKYPKYLVVCQSGPSKSSSSACFIFFPQDWVGKEHVDRVAGQAVLLAPTPHCLRHSSLHLQGLLPHLVNLISVQSIIWTEHNSTLEWRPSPISHLVSQSSIPTL